MNRVVIIDDHKLMRDSFINLINGMDGYKVVADSANAFYAMSMSEILRPDLILMDVCTENGESGIDACKEIKSKLPKTKVIIFTGFDEITYAEKSKEAGADAFVHKSVSVEFFISVVEDVMNGEKYFPEKKKIVFPTGDAPLTEREMAILNLLCKHKTRKEIAEELFLSEMTVKRHISNMLKKTGFRDSVDLAFYIISNGWINPMY